MSPAQPDPSKKPKPKPHEAEGGGTEFLVREVVHGEKTEAWGMLSQKILHYLKTRFGRASFPPGIEFNDFVSDVMLKIVASIESFEYRGKDSFWKWVQTLAGNMWKDLWRKHNRDRKIGLVARGDVGAVGSDTRPFSVAESTPTKDETPTQIVRFRELERAERDCVERLPANMREVYVMRRQHELSFAEISERGGGTNEATLRSHYMRARDRVRDCLGAKIDALGTKIQGWQ